MSSVNVNTAPERNEVILNHMPQVRALALKAYRRCPPSVSLDDLVSAGTVGLIQAVDRYDPRRRTQLKSLAEHRIRGAILDYLRQLDPLSRSVRQFHRRRDSVSACLEQRLCRRPLEAEIARALHIPLSRYRRLEREASAASLVSLQSTIEQAGDTILAGADPVPSMEQAERRHQLHDAIQTLPARH
jgi:RNA polymerase sigma factor FliA